jgi:hypothetical protein
MMTKAIKTFEVVEGSTRTMEYSISVRFKGVEVEYFMAPTMQGARDKFHAAGYQSA